MASKYGSRPTGTDGSDFWHRESVAWRHKMRYFSVYLRQPQILLNKHLELPVRQAVPVAVEDCNCIVPILCACAIYHSQIHATRLDEYWTHHFQLGLAKRSNIRLFWWVSPNSEMSSGLKVRLHKYPYDSVFQDLSTGTSIHYLD